MNALIPMAGAGSRFVEAGYKTTKPLLPIQNLPMVVSAAKALPQSEQYIFVMRDFQVENDHIDQKLNQYFSNCRTVVLDHLTEGQAVTCLKAKSLIDNDVSLVIGASDNGMIYDTKEFELATQKYDALVFTFRNNPAVVSKPQAYGWVKVNQFNEVEGMSVKVPLSNNPMNDHAVVGTFWFKHGSLFVEAAEHMIANNKRINNEFYVDECINDLIQLGYKVGIFEIEHYVCWGTPRDYETFNYWYNFF